MRVSDYLRQYKDLNIYFAPDYEQENEVLNQFKKINPNLSDEQVMELKAILESTSTIDDKYFVADLLYLYPSFSRELMDPLIECAIAHEDPSFNRIFLRPCINSFGLENVTNLLNQKGNNDSSKMDGIIRLKYWLRPPGNWS